MKARRELPGREGLTVEVFYREDLLSVFFARYGTPEHTFRSLAEMHDAFTAASEMAFKLMSEAKANRQLIGGPL